MVGIDEEYPKVPTTYRPEEFVKAILRLRNWVERETEQRTYCILTESTSVRLHGEGENRQIRQRKTRSEIQHWPSLGDGLQRALAIEHWAKEGIRLQRHRRCEVYMDEYLGLALELPMYYPRTGEHEYWSGGQGKEKYTAYEEANNLMRALQYAEHGT